MRFILPPVSCSKYCTSESITRPKFGIHEVNDLADLELKLVGGGYSWGLLEVSSVEGTGVVCASDWDDITLKVACRQLGFQGGHRVILPDSPTASGRLSYMLSVN